MKKGMKSRRSDTGGAVGPRATEVFQVMFGRFGLKPNDDFDEVSERLRDIGFTDIAKKTSGLPVVEAHCGSNPLYAIVESVSGSAVRTVLLTRSMGSDPTNIKGDRLQCMLDAAGDGSFTVSILSGHLASLDMVCKPVVPATEGDGPPQSSEPPPPQPGPEPPPDPSPQEPTDGRTISELIKLYKALLRHLSEIDTNIEFAIAIVNKALPAISDSGIADMDDMRKRVASCLEGLIRLKKAIDVRR